MRLCWERDCGVAGLLLEDRWWWKTWILTFLPLKGIVFAYHWFFSVELCGQWLLCFQASFGGEGAGEIRGIWLAFQICLDWFKAVY